MPTPSLIYVPSVEATGFEERAKACYPNETEDYFIGKVVKRHVEVAHIIPTLPEHVHSRNEGSVMLREAAFRRAKSLAAERSLVVLGSVHTHPHTEVYPGLAMLSKSDCKSFSDFEGIILAVLMIVPDSKSVGSFKTWWSYWQGHTPCPMKLRYV